MFFITIIVCVFALPLMDMFSMSESISKADLQRQRRGCERHTALIDSL